MKDHPGYGRIRGRSGPRTKKQLRYVRSKEQRLKAAESYRAYLETMLELEQRKPTLHDIGWKA